jgi:hypothetical protein
MRDDWYTPVHVLVGWGQRLRSRKLWDGLRAVADLCDGALAELAETPAETAPAARVDGDGPVQRELFE